MLRNDDIALRIVITAVRCAKLASKTGVGTKLATIGVELDFYWQFHWQSALLFDTRYSLSID